MQPQKRTNFHSTVQCRTPGPNMKGWPPSSLQLLLEFTPSAAATVTQPALDLVLDGPSPGLQGYLSGLHPTLC